ncbi:SDR family NAD(P)-dependent oxidoreductase [Novipirellula artificiosorum]|uniref:3-oxoacyl-[acyl-carrier-protein] reductase FabG n=1 Tax=Novipirellula artificiosorum TaxID=2528016 RepID=A0A5C6DJ42_9BACT|nr:SDR family oxidoreductase [Novipirellula artificiosorum]TWU36124.1 3-oxoacyl-[acyl-carrier-protein] reductase FabG [Novipirellula artificiosorum]
MTVLKGQRAVVSGSSRGIGRGIATELAKAGADVVVNYRSGSAEADEVVAECRKHGVRSFKVAANMGVQSEAEGLIDQAAELLGGLDIVVSNAAYSDRRLMLKQDLDEFRKTIDVTMYGAFYFVRRAAQLLVEAKSGGNIVVIGSPMGHLGMPGSMPYNMAKAALNQMAVTVACELAEHRIRCNILHPGWIDTPGERKFFSEETLQQKGNELPLGRLGKSEEMGHGVVFLCNPASEYITGSTLTIDGGIQMPFGEMYRVHEAEARADAEAKAKSSRSQS